MPKPLKLYTLYEGPDGPTVTSVHYGRFNKVIYHVVAYSVKQAVLLAARHQWSDGGPGLVEHSTSDQEWHFADRTTGWNPRLETTRARTISKASIAEALGSLGGRGTEKA